MNDTVRAAGGIVHRDGDVLLVHRPKYDDWTFPKGKAEGGEPDEDCALREVYEETGLECALEDELAPTHYIDSKGRPHKNRQHNLCRLQRRETLLVKIWRLYRWAPTRPARARRSLLHSLTRPARPPEP